MKSILPAVILLAASNTDSCGTEANDVRQNPDPQSHQKPAPSPEYPASQPAAEYDESKTAEPARREGGSNQ